MIPDQSRPGDRGSAAEPVATDGGADSGETLVATTTRDGVLLAADERTTRDTVVRSEDVRKLAQVHPTGAMGATTTSGRRRRSSGRSGPRSTATGRGGASGLT